MNSMLKNRALKRMLCRVMSSSHANTAPPLTRGNCYCPIGALCVHPPSYVQTQHSCGLRYSVPLRDVTTQKDYRFFAVLPTRMSAENTVCETLFGGCRPMSRGKDSVLASRGMWEKWEAAGVSPSEFSQPRIVAPHVRQCTRMK